MGGPGSGRRSHTGARNTTDEIRRIDIRRWNREGLLHPGNSFVWQWLRRNKGVASIWVTALKDQIELIYRQKTRDSDWKDQRYSIHLSWTRCHLGGQRSWFICPTFSCGRRVAILYSSGRFRCRHCLDLAYPSQRETPGDRAGRKANRIRKRLGWEPGILNGTGWKPDGMHWHTFWSLYDEHNRLARTTIGEIKERLRIPDPE